MSTDVRNSGAYASVRNVDMKVEVVVLPVADVDRAKEFYVRLGWRLDVTPPGIVQLTPPGSACSVQFGPTLTTAAPGSGKGYLIVSDIVAARDVMVAAGIAVNGIYHLGPEGPISGLDPDRRTYRSRAAFNDPDGNTWVLQEITSRLPGRVDSAETSFSSTNDLVNALKRVAAAHSQHVKRTGEEDPDWPDWYAKYMVAEQAGTELPL